VTKVNQGNAQPVGAAVKLGNWLTAPVNRVAFRRVRDVLSVAEIENDPDNVAALESAPVDQAQLTFTGRNAEAWTIGRFLDATYTDGFLILRDGRIAFEWYASGQSAADEHIVFSVTKSLIGSLVGILVAQRLLDPQAPVVHYLPELSASGFGQARVRDLLDMTVSLDFEEAYLVPDSPFARYREATGWHEVPPGKIARGMHAFLGEIAAGQEPHGTRFDYLSPNSDLLGWVCERAGGQPLPTLISQLIWKPMGAQSPASITLDRYGAPRAAGGFGCTLRDMARFGECMRQGGTVAGRPIVPSGWVEDIQWQGDRAAWKNGTLAEWLPGACYRSQWWITNDEQGAYFALGIYGHWIYICPGRGVVIVRQASPPVGPADKDRFRFELEALGSLAQRVGVR
jgi:CubicO group peptidase (beta-lactamase class C family)